MKWNWQKSDWAKWDFDSEKLQKYENEFLLDAWKISWALQYLHQEEREIVQVQLLSDEAMKTSEIEWEFLNRDSVQSSIKRKLGMKAETKNDVSEEGIAELMFDCFENFQIDISQATLCKWHEMICRGRGDLNDIGKYRSHEEPMQVVSGQIDRPKVHFEAPASSVVQWEMEEFFKWLVGSKLPPLTKAWVAHIYFISIHPFEDGNGRIVRAICEYILSQALQTPSLTTLSRQIESKRKEYYDILEKSNKDMNIQKWLEWFCEIVLEAQKYALSLIDFTICKTKLLDTVKGNINERQQRVLLRMFEAGPEWFIWWLSAANYIKITKATVPTTTRDLSDLVLKWVLKKTWERKSTRYWLNI